MSNEHPTDFRISYDGEWFHDGEPIKRAALAKLFSDRALILDEDGRYYLRTPYEKYPVEVEDVPFVIRSYDCFLMHTNMEESVELNAKSVWEMREGIPYIEVRDGLFARIGRATLYHLIEEHGAQIEIDDRIFPLGELEDE